MLAKTGGATAVSTSVTFGNGSASIRRLSADRFGISMCGGSRPFSAAKSRGSVRVAVSAEAAAVSGEQSQTAFTVY